MLLRDEWHSMHWHWTGPGPIEPAIDLDSLIIDGMQSYGISDWHVMYSSDSRCLFSLQVRRIIWRRIPRSIQGHMVILSGYMGSRKVAQHVIKNTESQ